MTDKGKAAVRRHRRAQKAKGLIRVEVQAPPADAALVREVVAVLRSGSKRAAEMRSLLRRSLCPRKSLLELLRLDFPDDVLEQALDRSHEPGREVDL